MLVLDCTTSRSNTAILAMTPADITRFWSKVDKTPGAGPDGECWPWTGCRNRDGYGCLKIARLMIIAPRISWALSRFRLPPMETPWVLHACDFRLCCRPDHLWAGTPTENANDMAAKGRAARRGGNHVWTLYPERIPRGEAFARAKLTGAMVSELRLRYMAGESIDSLATAMGTVRATVVRAVFGMTWKHIVSPPPCAGGPTWKR